MFETILAGFYNFQVFIFFLQLNFYTFRNSILYCRMIKYFAIIKHNKTKWLNYEETNAIANSY